MHTTNRLLGGLTALALILGGCEEGPTESSVGITPAPAEPAPAEAAPPARTSRSSGLDRPNSALPAAKRSARNTKDMVEGRQQDMIDEIDRMNKDGGP